MTDEQWEYFCDTAYFCETAYYDMWCVRRVGETKFGQVFHVTSENEAHALCALLNERHKS